MNWRTILESISFNMVLRLSLLIGKYNTIDKIAKDITTHLSDEHKKKLINEGMWALNLMSIRNNYGLWYCNPLTKSWREGKKDINSSGVDMTPNHPDNLSFQIAVRVVEILKNGQTHS